MAFLHNAFTKEEQKAIIKSSISTPDYDENDGGADTKDYIYLLSHKEATQYFATEDSRMAAPTPYAVEIGGWWWLRSPAFDRDSASIVYVDGSLNYYGVVNVVDGIRPAFKLHLDSLIF